MNDKEKLLDIFSILLKSFGKRNWWPADTDFEVVIGCILTQNVTWKSVEQAIIKLKAENLIDIDNILSVEPSKLAGLITTTRYYNQKAASIINFCEILKKDFNGELKKLFDIDTPSLRRYLLSLKGIGKETADSIILYAANKPIFVVDAYTKRVFSRLGYFESNPTYDEVQDFFQRNLSVDTYLYNEFHALIVAFAQYYCKSSKPLCVECPIKNFCKANY